jgi:hypothetical protein
MKKLAFLFIAFSLLTVSAVAQKSKKGKTNSYGEAFVAENVISLSELQEKMKTEPSTSSCWRAQWKWE